MKLATGAVSVVAASTLFVGIHALTPWLGPKTADIRTVAASNVSMTAGQSTVLLTVPADQRFILTDAGIADFAGGGLTDGMEVLEVDATGASTVKLPAGVFTMSYAGAPNITRGVMPTSHSDGLGAVFNSGTQVILHNSSVGTAPNSSYYFAGYFAAK